MSDADMTERIACVKAQIIGLYVQIGEMLNDWQQVSDKTDD